MLHSVREETKWKTLILEDCCVGSIWTPHTVRERGAVRWGGGGGRDREKQRERVRTRTRKHYFTK